MLPPEVPKKQQLVLLGVLFAFVSVWMPSLNEYAVGVKADIVMFAGSGLANVIVPVTLSDVVYSPVTLV
jgi:hypothetical protein